MRVDQLHIAEEIKMQSRWSAPNRFDRSAGGQNEQWLPRSRQALMVFRPELFGVDRCQVSLDRGVEAIEYIIQPPRLDNQFSIPPETAFRAPRSISSKTSTRRRASLDAPPNAT